MRGSRMQRLDPMNSIEIDSVLNLADWRAYQNAWASRLQLEGRTSRRMMLGIVVAAAVMAALLVALSLYLREQVPFAAVAIGACAATFGIMINMRRMRSVAQPNERGVVLGPSRITFDASGMRLRKDHSDIHHQWPLMQEVTLTTEHLFVWVDRVAALIVPIRDLPEGLDASAAAQLIRELAANAAAPQAVSVQDEAPAVGATRSIAPGAKPATSFLAWIGQLLILRIRSGAAPILSDRAILRAALGCLALWFCIDRLTAGPDAEFYAYGLVGVGWYASLVVSIALIWSRFAEPGVEFRSTLALALGFTPVAMVLAMLAIYVVPTTALLGALVLIAIYATFYGHAGLRSITARHQPRAAFAGLLMLSIATWFAHTNYVTPQFWYPPEEDSSESSADAEEYMLQWRQLEPLLLQQAERIDAAAASLERPSNLSAAAFFVGFAGTGEQRVFAGEIDAAARVIADKFGTATRSMRLVNDRRDLTTYPFASSSALRRTLSAVAKRMDLERDVLFLALSSHGSEDGELAVTNSGIPLNGMPAADVGAALRESGIKWRVIIVSACYSGAFIPELRNDFTIIITAAAADRASFGCSDDRDLTYFGEAFYRDALPASPDLRTAFQRTKSIISGREKAEDQEPSNPQAHFGRALERYLRQWGTESATAGLTRTAH